MCGILGVIDFRKQGKRKLSGRYLRHRGPDALNAFSDDAVSFLHARLAIIDRKETSHQPIETARYCLVANGEIYNYEEIRKEEGYRYCGTSDCEAIIHMYARFGAEGFCRLDGSFVFALYDRERSKVFLCRDTVGKKPLYFFHKEGEVLIFASNVTAIADNHPGRFPVDRSQVETYFRDGVISPEASLLEGVVPVLPGQFFEIDLANGTVLQRKLQKSCVDYGGFDYSNKDKVREAISSLIEQAVLKRLKNVERPVLLFSGGIDSTVLAYYMLKVKPSTELVSLQQPFGFLYDQPYIKAASRILGRKVHFVQIHKGFLKEHVDSFITLPDQPLAVYSYYFLSALALKAREFGRVLFTGDGGDEAFLGYGSISDWFGPGTQAVRQVSPVHSGPPLPAYYSDYAAKAVGPDLVGHGFLKVDKAISENQLEARCPFFDWDLLCFLRSIPAQYWQEAGVTKAPLKEILLNAGFAPSFVHRKKAGFFYPFKYVMIPRLSAMEGYIRKNQAQVDPAFLGASNPGSAIRLFMQFDRYWKLFVFLKFKEAYQELF